MIKKMKTAKTIILSLLAAGFVLVSCQEGVKKDEKEIDISALTSDKNETHPPEIKAEDITITNPLNQAWVDSGKSIYSVKCQSCHRLTGEKLVGPGWQEVTKRRAPVWIMNMITNTEMMLDNDAEARKLLELCMVRMPNQNLTKDQAREVIEFMRNNDGEK